MTDRIEQKALALVNEVAAEKGSEAFDWWYGWRDLNIETEALCRAIEQYDAFRQEVSDDVALAVDRTKQIKGNSSYVVNHMHKYIIAKPDPLVEAVCEINGWDASDSYNREQAKSETDTLRAAIEKRGGKIVWGEGHD